MSISDLIRRMAAVGAPPEAIAIAVEAIEAAQAAAPARARGGSAERMARKRARDAAASHVTPDVTHCDAESDVGDGRGDAETLSLPPSPQTPQPPTHTRGGATTREREAVVDDWPKGTARDHAGDLQLINRNLDLAREPGLITSLGEISRWRQQGFSWLLDVFPAIEAHAARARADPVKTWTYFTPAIARAHANRNRPLEPVQVDHAHERPHHDRRKAAFVDRLQAIDGAMDAAFK
ncbi:hypothetical protein E1H18_3191 [Caulobacter sp. RHG1]|nr:hypothetical protein [Caulobacter sp. RHG1]